MKQLLIFKHTLPGQNLKFLVGELTTHEYHYQIQSGFETIQLNRDEFEFYDSISLGEVKKDDPFEELTSEFSRMRKEISDLKDEIVNLKKSKSPKPSSKPKGKTSPQPKEEPKEASPTS